MEVVNISQVKSTLSQLVKAIEKGQVREIVIARSGRPVAKLIPMDTVPAGQRIGVARGKFEVPDTIDAHNKEVARLFKGVEPP